MLNALRPCASVQSGGALVRVMIASALFVAVAAVAWHYLGPVTVTAAAPSRGPAVEAVYGSGIVEPEVMVALGPKVSGRLQELAVDEGDTVRKGAVLARLDSRDLAATVAEWESRVRFGEAEFRRVEELYRRRLAAETDRDRARNELATATAARDRVREQLAEMTLRAPEDGVILRRDGEIGQLQRPGDILFWFSCCGGLRVSAEIDEEDIPSVALGQRVLIAADAFPNRVFEGTVHEITPKGDPVARSFRVRIALPADTPLRVGMTADCNIVVAERNDALRVPATAIAGDKLWVVRDGRLAEQPVTLGAGRDGLVEIRAGLAADDLVVSTLRDGLRPGRRARIQSGDKP
ncbi:MAG: efflux RND transporter periplasmic adaptor subunit [Gammaproteobacteria bacterium]|nr:efflux RND transporter periplasmic adaptor subunit [Gammaproteobacteria bacterium]